MNLILDCETISLDYNYICDIAWGFVKRNKLIRVTNYVVKEHLGIMASGNFSAPKMTATMQEVANGNAKIAEWDDIMFELKQDIGLVNNIYAYNATFDRNAIIKTCKALQSPETEYFTSSEIYDKWRCMWAWATNTILYKKSYIDFCEAHNFISEKGNIQTSAETALRYILNNPDYKQQHTARADVLDEYIIYSTIKKAVKCEYKETAPDDNSFKGSPWYNIKKLNKAINS